MKTLIFDLDGTLVDSAPGIVASLTHAVRALGHDFTPSAGITHLLGPPMTQVMAQLLMPMEMTASTKASSCTGLIMGGTASLDHWLIRELDKLSIR